MTIPPMQRPPAPLPQPPRLELPHATSSALAIASSGLSAQRVRMDVVAQNLANAETTKTPEGGPYHRRTVTLEPVLSEVDLDPEPTFTLDPRAIKLTETVDSLNAQGVHVRTPMPASTPAMIIPAEQQDSPSYRVGFNNFEVITKYNRSVKYAMTVNDLAQAIAERVRKAQP